MISLAHSLQGNRATYMVQPFTSAEFLLRMAFSSAWQTVCERGRGHRVTSGGVASPTPTIRVFGIKSILSFSLPRQLIITAAIGHAIISNAYNLLFWIHHTRPHLGEKGGDERSLAHSKHYSEHNQSVGQHYMQQVQHYRVLNMHTVGQTHRIGTMRSVTVHLTDSQYERQPLCDGHRYMYCMFRPVSLGPCSSVPRGRRWP